jgi:phosphohistidine phosphatase
MTRRRLVLLRHAKAEQGGRDRDRALTKRGRADAAAAGAWLASHDAVPEVAVVSPARRTVQTWEEVATRLPVGAEVVFDDRVYDNYVDGLLAAVRDVDAATQTLLVVGHNPSTHALALHLAADGPTRAELAGGFPTATVAVFDVAEEWSDVGDSPADLVAVTTCRASQP